MQPFYALLANGMTAALAGPTGSIDWLPIPRFDGETIFGRLLDRHGGGYLSLEPDDPVPTSQRYLPEGLGLETTFHTDAGPAVVKTWMAIGRNAIWMHVQTPVTLRLTCRPGFSYGAIRPAYFQVANGVRFQNPRGVEQAQLMIQGPNRATDRMDQWLCGPGTVTVVFRMTTEALPDMRWLTRPIPSDPDRLWLRTSQYWKSTRIAYEGPHAELFERSVQVIRGLTYRPTGAPIAAATTSLPEIPGAERQWDYRYVWVRDSAYAAESLLMAGDAVGARRIAEFLLNCVALTDRAFPAPFFRVDGTVPDGERDMLWLQGFDQTRPARAGNGAVNQLQLDLAGTVLWLVYRLWEITGDSGMIQQYWWAIATLTDWAQQAWAQSDASLWEYRSIRGQHTHSRVMSWVGLKAGQALASTVMADRDAAQRWGQAAAKIHRTLTHEAEASGSFTTRSTGGAPDAALLTLPLYGFVPVTDAHFAATLQNIEETLVVDGLVYRYREDDLGQAHYPFMLAGFWYARVLLRKGMVAEADAVIARHVAQATPLGLFGEHADMETGAVRGNFPQLFSHSALIMTLAERERVLRNEPLPGAPRASRRILA